MARLLPVGPRVSERINRYDDALGPTGLLLPIDTGVDYDRKPWPWWCVYGDPCQPSELTDEVLWATCTHPVDLSDGAAERWESSYPERRRAEGWGS